jgi:hypothetical protein
MADSTVQDWKEDFFHVTYVHVTCHVSFLFHRPRHRRLPVLGVQFFILPLGAKFDPGVEVGP